MMGNKKSERPAGAFSGFMSGSPIVKQAKKAASQTGRRIDPVKVSNLLRAEFEIAVQTMALEMVKSVAEVTGKSSGQLRCPVCRAGVMSWSLASSNGHARVVCDRPVEREDGTQGHCINAME